MWRASVVVTVLALASIPSAAHADEEPRADDHAQAFEGDTDPRSLLAAQLADESAVLDRTLVTVGDKLTAAEAVRVRRLRAAYRLLHAPLRTNASLADRMAAARRRAAARLLVDRDAAERGLLVDEASSLRAAATRTTGDAAKLATITLPTEISRPARGTIERGFGTFEHDRSKAILSRRGIDIEVEPRAPATAPADGTVRYAGPIRGLDQGVILDHGDYLTVIGKLGELSVPVGAPVHRGDRVGRAARHRVYFEVRVRVGPGGLPIDPVPLFETTRKD